MMNQIQINPLNLEKIVQFNRLFICGKSGGGKSHLANQIAYQLAQTHQVFIFYEFLPFFKENEIPPPYRFSSLINLYSFKRDNPKELIEHLESISQLDNLSKSTAIIFDELGGYELEQIKPKLLSVSRNLKRNNLNMKLIILSQEPATIFSTWNEFTKLFGRLDFAVEIRLNDLIQEKLKHTKNEIWKLKHKYYLDWLNCYTKIEQDQYLKIIQEKQRKSYWLLDEINKPLSSEILLLS